MAEAVIDPGRYGWRGCWCAALLVAVGAGCQENAAPRKQASASLAGVELSLWTPAGSPLHEALPLRLAEWEARTGSTVAVVAEGAEDRADVRIVEGSNWAALAPVAIPADALKADSTVQRYLPAVYRNVFARQADKTFALPLAGDMVFLWYRTDLFDDPQLSEAYRKATGASLEPPATWEAFVEIARFLKDQGTVEFGCVEATAGIDGVRNFLVRAAAYAKGPNWSSFVIDAETGAARIGAGGFEHGLRVWLDALRLSPAAGGKSIDAPTARRILREGRAAFLVDRLPPTIDSDGAAAQKLADKIGVAPLPGATILVHPRTGAVQKLERPNRCVHFATTGWYAVLGRQPQPPAARLLLFLTDENECHYLAQGARQGLLPLHPVLLGEPGRFRGYGLALPTIAKVFDVYQQGLNAENWVADLRIGSAAVLQAQLARELQAAVAGKIDPATALRNAQARWQASIAPEQKKVRDEYRNSLGLPALVEP